MELPLCLIILHIRMSEFPFYLKDNILIDNAYTIVASIRDPEFEKSLEDLEIVDDKRIYVKGEFIRAI